MRLLGRWDQDPLWASVYDWIVEHPHAGGAVVRAGLGSDLRRLHEAAAEVGRLPAGSRVLDVPCGGGVALRGVRPGQGLAYVAADIAPAMLRRTTAAARRRGVADQVAGCVADVARLPFGDGSFDHVVALTSLHCFPDPEAAVHELVRVLRPGAGLTLSTLLEDAGLRTLPVRVGGRLAGLLGPGCTEAQLRRWLAEAGAGEVRVERSGALAYASAVSGRRTR